MKIKNLQIYSVLLEISKKYNKKDLVQTVYMIMDREDIHDMHEDLMINSYRTDLNKIELLEVLRDYADIKDHDEMIFTIDEAIKPLPEDFDIVQWVKNLRNI